VEWRWIFLRIGRYWNGSGTKQGKMMYTYLMGCGTMVSNSQVCILKTKLCSDGIVAASFLPYSPELNLLQEYLKRTDRKKESEATISGTS